MAEQFAHPELIVTPEWLNAHLGDPNVRVVDTRTAEKYAAGHIPGAVVVDVFALRCADTSPEGLQAWTALMEESFSAAGIAAGQTVVCYEDNSGSMSTRGVWALAYLGHDGARLLDGGLKAWQAAGYPLSTEPPQVARTTFRARPRPDELATYQDVLGRLNDGATDVVDVRNAGEYAGTEIRSARGGRVPGAVHLDWVQNLDADGRLKSAAELEAMYAGLGLDREREVITYCQGGYRAANTWLVLRMLGYPRVRNYLGSWGEWGNREGLPIENLTLPAER